MAYWSVLIVTLFQALLSSSQSITYSCREKENWGLKTVWLSRLFSPLFEHPFWFLPLLNTPCPNPSDLMDTRDVSLGDTFAPLRCCFKVHVSNSKWQREMGNLFPQKPPPTPSKVEDAVCTGLQLPNKLCVTRKLLCQGISTESQNILMCPIHISWGLEIYCWPNPAVLDGSIFILIRERK